jgi:hypothetical protein
MQTTDHGVVSVEAEVGPTLPGPNVETVYLGSYWQHGAGAATVNQIDTFFKDITNIRHGAFLGHAFLQLKLSAGTTVIDGPNIQRTLSRAVAQHALPTPSPDTLFVVFTPPKVHVTIAGHNIQDAMGGYHQSFVDGKGHDIVYAVVANLAGNTDIPGLTATQQVIAIASHVGQNGQGSHAHALDDYSSWWDWPIDLPPAYDGQSFVQGYYTPPALEPQSSPDTWEMQWLGDLYGYGASEYSMGLYPNYYW